MGSEWETVCLSDVLETIIDYRGKTPPKSAVGIPVLTAASVKDGRVLKDKVSYISHETYAQVTTRGFPKAGDVLITTEAPCGEVAPFPTDRTYHITRRIMALRGAPKLITPEYLLYVLMSNTCQNQIYARVRGSTVPRVLKTDITGLNFPLPSLSEQKGIGAFLSSIDKKIILNNQINQTLEQMAQTLFKSWFVDFDPVIDNALDAGSPIPEVFETRIERRKAVRESAGFKPLPDDVRQLFPSQFEESELGWVPKGWKIETLSEVAEAIIDHRGKTPKKLGGDWAEEGTPALSAKNIKAGKVVRHDTIRYVDDELFNKWMKVPLKPQDILMTSEAPMGEMLYLAKESNYLLSQRLYGIRTNKELITGSYLYNWLQTTIAKADLEGRATGTTVVGIRQAELKKVAVLCPDIRISQAYSYHADSLYLKVEENSLQSLQLEKLRDILLPKLISGELRLDSPEVEQAKALVE